MRPVGHLLVADPVDHDDFSVHGDRRRAGEAFPPFQIGPAENLLRLPGSLVLIRAPWAPAVAAPVATTNGTAPDSLTIN